MRILMVAERLSPAIGGVERHVAGLTRTLIGKGHNVTLVAPKHDDDLPDQGEINGAQLLRIPTTGNKRRDYTVAWRWWQRNRRLLVEADVVHFHEVYALLHWFGPAMFLHRKSSRYLTYHGYEMRFPIPTRARLYRTLSSHLVSGTFCVGHYLKKWFNLNPHAVTYGAVSLPAEPPTMPAQPQALFIGRIAADTGLDIYLRALLILQHKHRLRLPLLVCGDGPRKLEMENFAYRNGLDVTFLGFQKHPERYLGASTVAFVSGYLAVLEAMAFRRPVFSVYHNAVKEDYLRMIPDVSDTLSIAGSSEELGSQLVVLLSGKLDPTPRIEHAYEFAAGHNWSRLADMYLDLWSR